MLRKLTLFKHTDSVQTFDCRHEIYSSVLFVKRFYILSTKQHKKAKEKNLSSIIEQDALSGNYMENKMFVWLYSKRDRSKWPARPEFDWSRKTCKQSMWEYIQRNKSLSLLLNVGCCSMVMFGNVLSLSKTLPNSLTQGFDTRVNLGVDLIQ